MGLDLGALAGAAAQATPWGAGFSAVSGLASGGPSTSGDATAPINTGGITSPVVIGGYKTSGGTASIPLWVLIGGAILGVLFLGHALRKK